MVLYQAGAYCVDCVGVGVASPPHSGGGCPHRSSVCVCVCVAFVFTARFNLASLF